MKSKPTSQPEAVRRIANEFINIGNGDTSIGWIMCKLTGQEHNPDLKGAISDFLAEAIKAEEWVALEQKCRELADGLEKVAAKDLDRFAALAHRMFPDPESEEMKQKHRTKKPKNPRSKATALAKKKKK